MNKQLGLSIALALAASTAMAGTAQIESGGQITTMEYRDGGLLRMGVSDESYMLVRDEKLYMVNGTPGQEMVIDASAVLGAIGSMVPEIAPTASEVVSIDKTGRRETVAGIPGEVWIFHYTDADGVEQSEEMVVSSDPRAAEFRDAMQDFGRSMMITMGQDPDAVGAMDDTLDTEGVGMLRVGDSMKVVSISRDTVSESRFELPAAPTDMSALSGLFSGAAGGQAGTADADAETDQGGLFGGIFSRQAERQAERQQDRAENRVQNEVDRAADRATDSVIGGALDRLFGR